MGFKGLEDRFLAKSKGIYHRYSTRDGSESGQPYLEFKPDTPGRNETTHDTQTLPVGSTKRDIIRLGSFLKSRDGIVFMLKQQGLQTGNTFSETRLINPAFVIANAVPFIHVRRPLMGEADFAPTGNVEHKSLAASDPKIQGAGRLQVQTSNAVIASVMGKGGASGLLGLLPHGTLTDKLLSALSLKDVGSLGVDERPELKVGGADKWFSIAIWHGFRKQASFTDNLTNIRANLRVGNINGAVKAANNAISNIANNVRRTGIIPFTNIAPDGRNSTVPGIEGSRYFIVSPTDADRYLRDSIQFSEDNQGRDRPHVMLPYLDRRPYSVAQNENVKKGIQQFIEIKPNFSTSVRGFSLSAFGLDNAAKSIAHNIGNVAKSVGQSIASTINTLTKNVRQAIPTLPVSIGIKLPFSVKLHTDALRQLTEQTPIQDLQDNPAEAAMLYTRTSLHQRYLNDEHTKAIQAALDAQKEASFNYWQNNRSNIGIVSEGKYRPGQESRVIANQRTGVRRYYHDKLNEIDVIENAGNNTVFESTRRRIKEQGEDLINVLFYDFVNRRAIPFRAFITDIHETTTPEISDTRYIGRLERNIVYVGVQRELSFGLKVHAFNEDEMGNIWTKVNYMTGLCFPAGYSNGFMVPPFVKFTIGDLWRDQPCFIRNLTHNIDQDTPWEISENHQAPHGVSMQITLSILEKKQMQTGDVFYSFGQPRSESGTNGFLPSFTIPTNLFSV